MLEENGWDYIKSLIYANEPATLEELRKTTSNVNFATFRKYVAWVEETRWRREARGGHLTEIEFNSSNINEFNYNHNQLQNKWTKLWTIN